MSSTEGLTELSKLVVERKKAIIIPAIRIVLNRLTALVDILTNKANAKQNSRELSLWEIPSSGTIRCKRFSVIPPPEVIYAYVSI